MNAVRRLVWFTALGGLAVGCSQQAPKTQPHSPSALHTPTVLLFFVDGLDCEILAQMAADDRVPNIQRHFIEGGVTIENAIASLPPITYPNAVSLITGKFPGQHGVMGNQWFDRKARLIRDYGSPSTYQRVNEDFDCPTIFEILSDRFTVNVQGHTRRGVSVTFDNKIASGVEWFLGDYSDVDALVGDSVNRVIEVANRRGQPPTVYMSYFPGLDEVGHRFGSDSDAYARALVVVDQAIGHIIAQSRAAWGQDLYCVLISDHGHVSTPKSRRVDIADQLSRLGLTVHQGPVQSPSRWMRSITLDKCDAVLVVGAYRRAAIHLRGPGGWDESASQESIDRVVQSLLSSSGVNGLSILEGVESICYRFAQGGVEWIDPNGRYWVKRRRRGDRYEYKVVPLSDTAADSTTWNGQPHDMSPQRIPANRWMTSREWLDATASDVHPDFVVQVSHMFDSTRAADVVLFAASDWTFGKSTAGGHGSSLKRDMHIPMYWSGPTLAPGGRVPAARLVDVVPTIIDLVGQGDDPRVIAMDGQSILAILRSAAAK